MGELLQTFRATAGNRQGLPLKVSAKLLMGKVLNSAIFKGALGFLLVFMLLSCSTVTNQQIITRIEQADKIAQAANWQYKVWQGADLSIASYVPETQPEGSLLRVYIEGDGRSWASKSIPSSNPTPTNAVALKLAVLDKSTAVYLARPCQFVLAFDLRGCKMSLWTSHRFSEQVVDASNQVISQMKAAYLANEVELIGYSGGGAVAAIIAARRTDVVRLVTIAGNLDPVLWAQHHHITPLFGSLSPMDSWRKLLAIQQVHYVGAEDKVVPELVARSYQSAFPKSAQPEVIVLPDTSHTCCWQNLNLSE